MLLFKSAKVDASVWATVLAGLACGRGLRHRCLVSQSTHSRDSVWFRILNVLLHLLLSYLVYLPRWTRPLLNLTLYSNKLSHCILKVPMLKVRCLGSSLGNASGYFGVLALA